MNFKIKIKNQEYCVEIKETKEKTEIMINGDKYFFDQKQAVAPEQENKKSVLEKEKIKEIKAPLSGNISQIFVKPGEEIRPGQKLITLSAMKMENDILSETRGKIKNILIKTEQNIKEGEVLIILE